MQVGLSVSGVLLLAFLWILKAVLEEHLYSQNMNLVNHYFKELHI
ncbi:hypothetical protein RchiOBHm_Chr5g0028291 [Rosa chinensis]|uniref:Uncharacterized protein n=1 Tax=Rosa chinensis TaxID=74649 RepID=A0A2P6Q9E8_ROSCH|nr:hypothetical protein RchiOBHm_Chr5g0028291 [Rosa chinensis]